MPEVTYTTTMNIPRDVIWDFVKDMNNWAPFVTGYQKHEIIDDTDSIWHLKGDVGVLSREVRLKAHITSWEGPDKVEFTLEGLNEKVDGGGTLLMEDWVEEAEPEKKPKKPWFGRRFLNWLFRKMFKRMHGEGPQRQLVAKPSAKLSFTLRMDAGGVTGPLVNAMLGPMLMPAAEDLANKIAAHLEAEHGGRDNGDGSKGDGSKGDGEGEAAAA